MIPTLPLQICEDLLEAESVKEAGRPAGYARPDRPLFSVMEPSVGPVLSGARPFPGDGPVSAAARDGFWPLELSGQAVMEEPPLEYRSWFWQMLLSGQAEKAACIYPRIKDWGGSLAPGGRYKVAVAVWEPDGVQLHAARLTRISRLIQEESSRISVVWKGRLIFILEAGQAEGNALQSLLDRLTDLSGGQRVGLCLSRACPVGALAEGYREAVKIAAINRRCGRTAALTEGKDLGVCALLAGLPDRPAADFTRLLLEPLRAYDRKHNSMLCATLKVYLQTGCNTKAAAQTLCTHYNTVAYRLERIQEITGLDLKDVETQFSLRLAFKLEELRAMMPEEGREATGVKKS